MKEDKVIKSEINQPNSFYTMTNLCVETDLIMQ